jgi:hypothetical protein
MREHLRQVTVTAAICVLAIAAYTTIKDGTRAQAAPAASARMLARFMSRAQGPCTCAPTGR